MSDFAQTESEAKRGRVCNKTRKTILKTFLSSIESEENTRKIEAKLAEQEKQFGRNSFEISKLRKDGMNARIAAIPLDLNQFENEQDRNNYKVGFIENGNRLILGNLEKLSSEELEAYGRNDYISGLKPSDIPEKLKLNPSYTQGNLMASILDGTKAKGRR